MRRIGDIMQELGFREGASERTAEAFVKNLVRSACGAEVKQIADYRKKQPKKNQVPRNLSGKKVVNGTNSAVQMCFDLEDE